MRRLEYLQISDGGGVGKCSLRSATRGIWHERDALEVGLSKRRYDRGGTLCAPLVGRARTIPARCTARCDRCDPRACSARILNSAKN
jgi:hypothetical protein